MRSLTDYLGDGLRDLREWRRDPQPVLPDWEASGFAAHGHDTGAAIAALTCSDAHSEGRAEFHLPTRAECDFTPPGGLGIEVVAGTTHFLPMERPDLVRVALVRRCRV